MPRPVAATPVLAQRVEQWREHTRVQALRLEARARLMRLMQRTVQWLHEDGPQQGVDGPRFACSCSRDRVSTMLKGLGEEEVQGIIDERGSVEVGCEFCGQQYRYDAVDAAQLFTEPEKQPPGSHNIQ